MNFTRKYARRHYYVDQINQKKNLLLLKLQIQCERAILIIDKVYYIHPFMCNKIISHIEKIKN